MGSLIINYGKQTLFKEDITQNQFSIASVLLQNTY